MTQDRTKSLLNKVTVFLTTDQWRI